VKNAHGVCKVALKLSSRQHREELSKFHPILIQIAFTVGTVGRWNMTLRTVFALREGKKFQPIFGYLPIFQVATSVKFDGVVVSQARMRTRGIPVVFIVVGFVRLCAVLPVAGKGLENTRSVKVNPVALRYAKELISEGRVVIDRKGTWTQDRPSTDVENEFIRQHGFSEYAKWHLGIDERYGENTKRRYKFSYGDSKTFIAVGCLLCRAGEYNYSEIESAAAKVREMIEVTRKSAR
jgi:hypothetical protein